MPPLERLRERTVLPFDRARYARDALDATVAYLGVAHAPPGSSRTRRDRDGGIVLETALRGRVVSVGTDGLAVEHSSIRDRAFHGGRTGVTSGDGESICSRVRHLLPEAIDLGALVGETVSLALVEKLRNGRSTVDARIHDAEGGLILWARDGELPDDRASYGLAIRMRMAESGRGLVIAHRTGLAIVRGTGLALVDSDVGPLLALVLRTGDDDAAFVMLRR